MNVWSKNLPPVAPVSSGFVIELTERLLYRDGMMLILNKPAGIAVHAGPGGGPTLEDGFNGLRFGLPTPPDPGVGSHRR